MRARKVAIMLITTAVSAVTLFLCRVGGLRRTWRGTITIGVRCPKPFIRAELAAHR